jgi:hypothetical protein
MVALVCAVTEVMTSMLEVVKACATDRICHFTTPVTARPHSSCRSHYKTSSWTLMAWISSNVPCVNNCPFRSLCCVTQRYGQSKSPEYQVAFCHSKSWAGRNNCSQRQPLQLLPISFQKQQLEPQSQLC